MELSFRDYDFRVYPDNMLTFFNDSNREAYNGQGQIAIISVDINQGGEPTGCECTRANHQYYADMHNYSYTRYTTPNARSKGDVRFNKMAYVIDKIDEKRSKGDPAPILLLDCDAAITNKAIRIEDMWNMFARKSTDIVIARDPHWHQGSQINSGVILLRPSAWNRALFSDIIRLGRIPRNGHLDQPRLIEQLALRGQLNLTPKTEYELNPKVTVISQRNMNAFGKRNVNGVEAALFREKDWMVHLAGFHKKERMKKLSDMGLCQEGD